MKRLFLMCMLLTFFTGCRNLVYRPRDLAGGTPYSCTIPVAIQVGDAVAGPWNHSIMRVYDHCEAQFMFPWLLIDLPCEVVVDTLLLPFDL